MVRSHALHVEDGRYCTRTSIGAQTGHSSFRTAPRARNMQCRTTVESRVMRCRFYSFPGSCLTSQRSSNRRLERGESSLAGIHCVCCSCERTGSIALIEKVGISDTLQIFCLEILNIHKERNGWQDLETKEIEGCRKSLPFR